MSKTADKQLNLASLLREEKEISLSQKLQVVGTLSLPAILAQIAEIIMEYIDSSMVGQLGASASASIGLVASSTWLVGGLLAACGYGFSVQVAHAIGAGDEVRARRVLRQSIVAALIHSIILLLICTTIAPHLPAWLHAEESIHAGGTSYFMVYALFLPVRMLYFLMNSMLQCSGNMKTPSILGTLLCFLDVLYNAVLIFPTRTIVLGGFSLVIPGAGLNVTGAALGTALAYVTCLIPMAYYVCIKSPVLSLRMDRRQMAMRQSNPASLQQNTTSEAGNTHRVHEAGSPAKIRWIPEWEVLRKALQIGVPLAMQQAALSVAQVLSTRIVAPLGTVAIAANSFAVTVESFCYMPGYGISSASTMLVGQSFGAKRKDLAKSFAWLTTIAAMILMAILGVIMYFLCPVIFRFLTPDTAVQELGIEVLRIELFAEPLFAASIAVPGALRGAGDTLAPFVIDLFAMWGVRLTLAWFLASRIGLPGVWIAMATELSVRGIIYLIRLARGKWLQR